jgi:hypothetical protein
VTLQDDDDDSVEADFFEAGDVDDDAEECLPLLRDQRLENDDFVLEAGLCDMVWYGMV